jgi:hypothetical protein
VLHSGVLGYPNYRRFIREEGVRNDQRHIARARARVGRERVPLMAVKVVFRCEQCGSRPDRVTQRTLEGQLLDRTLGEYRDAQPGGWLVWTAGGPLGCKRYACPEHRDDLVERLRRDYGTIRCGVWKSEPFPALWPDGFCGLDERELEELLGDREGSATKGPAPAHGAAGARSSQG